MRSPCSSFFTKNSGMDTLSGFVRAMIFDGYIVQMDENVLREIGKLANNIANNINQIAARVNATNNIYKEDIEEIKNLANQLWKPLLFLQSKALQLKH
ncbi:MAG: plasmid mobilization relaxosome protein MobC [Ruminococcus sp.]|nr:plasmid mobilization relaxosome protein MobC [Ruminococcus sp.]